MTHKRIYGGQYPIIFDVLLGYGNSDKAAIYKIIKRGVSDKTFAQLKSIIDATDLEDKAGWHFCYNGHYIVVMHLFNQDIAYYYGILQHELHHCVRASGRHLAFPQSEAAEEYYAYLTGYITEKIYNKLWT